MLLSARILRNALSVNVFEYAEAAEFTEGDTPSLFFQLIDATLDKSVNGFKPSGRRYMPAAGATLQVTIDNIDDAKKVIRSASQPFANDPSIWKVDILATDTIKGTSTLRLVLTEGAVVTRGRADAAIRVSPVR